MALALRVAKLAAAVALAAFALPAAPWSKAWLTAVISTAVLVTMMVRAGEGFGRRRDVFVAAFGGVLGALLFIVAPATWLACAVTQLALIGALLTLHPRREVRRIAIAGATGIIGVPIALSAAVSIAGAWLLVKATWSNAVPVHPERALALVVARALIVAALLKPREPSRFVAWAIAAAAALMLWLRVALVTRVASIDQELFWAEAPMLVNAIKLELGAPLYGPPSELNSYSYSPLLDLAHRTVLSPFGKQLDLHAHRLLVLLAQLAAASIAVASLRRALVRLPIPLRVAAPLLVTFAALSNLLAAAVHPDHALLLCFSVALALVADGDRMRPRLRDALMLLVTPIAVAFKLSGGGIGIALGLIALKRRDKRALGLLVVSGALTLATIPLFDKTLGSFSFYAITLQRSHALDLPRFFEPPWTSFFGFALVGVALTVLGSFSTTDPKERRTIDEMLALTLAMGVMSLPAAAKYAGRENNLAILVFGLVVIAIRVASASPRRATLAMAVVVWGGLVTRPPERRPPDSVVAAAHESTESAASLIRVAQAKGEPILVPATTLPLIRAGRLELPRDRFHSAVELYFGQFPEGELLAARIREGAYAQIVVPPSVFSERRGPAQSFQRMVESAIDSRYAPVPGVPGAYQRREPTAP